MKGVSKELSAITEALLNPKIYPHPADKVEMVETYISFVFLAGDYVYKIKKPVDYGYLDFTTLEKRLFYCQREVELNRRLCPDIYLGVFPIMRIGDKFTIDGIGEPFLKGEIIEYAVKMRRLLQDRMLDYLLEKGEVNSTMMVAVADKLAEFHRRAETNHEIQKFGKIIATTNNCAENFQQTERFVGKTITQNQWEKIKGYAFGFLGKNAELFNERADEGRVKDCHGDLHTSHICFLKDDIAIFDCIEFNDRFRYCDVASEVAFLAMGLDFHGRSDLSRIFVDAYIKASGDSELLKLLDFYKVYRAVVRGKVNSFRLDDPDISQEERGKALDIARRYFGLAKSYIEQEE